MCALLCYGVREFKESGSGPMWRAAWCKKRGYVSLVLTRMWVPSTRVRVGDG